MKKTHLYTSDQKLKWFGYGEWIEEPDVVEFTHDLIDCKIVRTVNIEPFSKEKHCFGGNLCGYVVVPLNSEFYKKNSQDINIDVHGGLTFCEHNDIQHWIGFDCAHTGDLVPSVELFRKQNACKNIFPIPEEFKKYSIFNPTYRNIEFCIEECKSMANQIKQQQSTK